MFKINLPIPNDELIAMIHKDLQLAKSTYESPIYKREGEVDFIYFHGESSKIGITEYQSFFDEDINFTGMLFKPDDRTISSSLAPHPDTGRLTGLNFILDTGGSNVVTTWYNKTNPDLTYKEWAKEINDTLVPWSSYKYEPDTWYAMDSSRFHSVKNITSDRLILTISLRDLKFTDFLLKYRHLIDSIV